MSWAGAPAAWAALESVLHHAVIPYEVALDVVADDARPTLAEASRLSGEALSAVLLECTIAGMATCTLTHMTEFAPSRDIIRQVIGNRGQPQLPIRIGKSPAMDPHIGGSARRPLAEALEIRW